MQLTKLLLLTNPKMRVLLKFLDPSTCFQLNMHFNSGSYHSVRSAGTGQLVVYRVQTKHGEMSFSLYASHC